MKSGIYCFKNIINGKMYVGQSIDMQTRIQSHNKALNRGRDSCVSLQHSVSKYGIKTFDVFVLETCEIYELNEREKYWINKLNSLVPNGYNIRQGGNEGISEETRRKISQAKTGKSREFFTRRFAPRAKPKNSSSKYFGVSKRIYKGKYEYWRTTINFYKRKVILGQFKYEIDAAKKYDEYVISNNLPRPLNFPNDVV